MDEFEEIKELVLSKEKENKIVYNTVDGLMETDIDEFIKTPVESMLYDLNRDKLTILTFIKEEKWVNDYACMLVIKKLKEKLAFYEN